MNDKLDVKKLTERYTEALKSSGLDYGDRFPWWLVATIVQVLLIIGFLAMLARIIIVVNC